MSRNEGLARVCVAVVEVKTADRNIQSAASPQHLSLKSSVHWQMGVKRHRVVFPVFQERTLDVVDVFDQQGKPRLSSAQGKAWSHFHPFSLHQDSLSRRSCTMSLFILLSLVSFAFAQSLVQPVYDYSSLNSNSCLKRSVFLYTSESSTYVVTDIGTTSLSATPTYCANASIIVSTVYGANLTVTTAILASTLLATTVLPASTITVIQQPNLTLLPVTSTPTTGAVVADNGFETGNNSPFNSSTSSSGVSAQVVQNGTGLLQPYAGDDYL